MSTAFGGFGANRGGTVYITGDVDGLNAALEAGEAQVREFATKAGAQLERLEAKAKEAMGAATGRTGVTGAVSAAGVGMGKLAAMAGTAAAAWVLTEQTIRGAMRTVSGWVDAAKDAEAAQAELETAFKNAGVAIEDHRVALDATVESFKRLGVEDETYLRALARGITVTKNYADATHLARIAMDLSVARHIDANTAMQMVIRAYNGQAAALTRMGIPLVKITREQDRLKDGTAAYTREEMKAAKAADDRASRVANLNRLEAMVTGQLVNRSKTTEGALDRLRARYDDLSEALGRGLTPALTRVANKLADMFDDWARAWPKYAKQFEKFWNAVEDAFVEGARVVRAVWDRFGDAITFIMKSQLGTAVGVVRDGLKLIAEVFRTISDLLQGNWGDAWEHIKNIPAIALTGMANMLRGMGGMLLEVGKHLGAAIYNGMAWALEQIGNMAAKAVTGPFNAITGALNAAIPGADPLPSLSIGSFDNVIPRLDAGGWGGGGSPLASAAGSIGSVADALRNITGAGDSAWQNVGGTGSSSAGRDATGSTVGKSGGTTKVKLTIGVNLEPAIRFAESQLGVRYRWGGNSPGHAWDCSHFAWQVARRILRTDGKAAYTEGFGNTTHLWKTSTPAKGDEAVVYGFTNDTRRGIYPGHMGIRLNGTWYEAGDPVHKQTSAGSFTILRVPAGLAKYLTVQVTGTEIPEGERGVSAADRKVDRAFIRSVANLGGLPASEGRSSAEQELADRTVERGAIADAKAKGITDEEKLRSIGERAVDTAHLQQLHQEAYTYNKAKAAIEQKISKLQGRRAAWAKALLNTRNQAQREKARDVLKQVAEDLKDAWQALRDVMDLLAENQAQQGLLSGDIADLSVDINAPATDLGGGDTSADSGPSYTDILNANTAMLNSEWLRTALGAGDLGTGGATAIQAAMGLVAGRYVSIRVDASSLAGAVASASGDAGYVSAPVVPSGV